MRFRFPAVFLVCLALQSYILWRTEFPKRARLWTRGRRWVIPIYSLRFFADGLIGFSAPARTSPAAMFLLGGLVLAGWALAWVIYILWDLYDRNKR